MSATLPQAWNVPNYHALPSFISIDFFTFFLFHEILHFSTKTIHLPITNFLNIPGWSHSWWYYFWLLMSMILFFHSTAFTGHLLEVRCCDSLWGCVIMSAPSSKMMCGMTSVGTYALNQCSPAPRPRRILCLQTPSVEGFKCSAHITHTFRLGI